MTPPCQSIGWLARSGVGSKGKRSRRGRARTAFCFSMRPAAAYADVDELRTRRARRDRLARPHAAQHLLSRVAAVSARLAERDATVSPRRGRGSTICCGFRAAVLRSRASRSKTTRSCRGRRFCRNSSRAGCRSSVRPAIESSALRRVLRTTRSSTRCRSAAGRERSGSVARAARRRDRPRTTQLSRRRRVRAPGRLRGQPCRALSRSARSSTSRRGCCGSTRNEKTSPV